MRVDHGRGTGMIRVIGVLLVGVDGLCRDGTPHAHTAHAARRAAKPMCAYGWVWAHRHVQEWICAVHGINMEGKCDVWWPGTGMTCVIGVLLVGVRGYADKSRSALA